MSGAVLLALSGATLAGDAPRLQALNWTAPGHERQALLEQPATCLDPLAPPEAVIGEALFNSPALLGGQAERAGLSCAGCHANGRRSAGFFLDGISGEPGTADISTSFFALPRANPVFDPRPIPDLALHGKVSRDRASGELEPFLRGLVVEEFSGAEPGPAAVSALAAYVRAVRTCPGVATQAKSLADDLRVVTGSVAAAQALLGRGDRQSARVAVRGARKRLELIHERMAGGHHAGLRGRLVTAARDLAPLEMGDAAALDAWMRRFERDLVPALRRAERHSLYNSKEVDRWLARRH